MHDKIYKFFNDIENIFPCEKYNNHASTIPVPYTIIDDFLPTDIYDQILLEIENIDKDSLTTFENKLSRRKECRNFTNVPLIQTLSNSFQTSKFIYWLEQITDTKKLIPDPHLRGAGFARVLSGEKLGLHTDFNWNDQLSLNRKVNLILYTNKEWYSEWNGNLEFWNKEGNELLADIEPKGNRLVFWNYEPWLIHGHSKIMNTPLHVGRDSLIQFYYTSNATWEVTPERSNFYD